MSANGNERVLVYFDGVLQQPYIEDVEVVVDSGFYSGYGITLKLPLAAVRGPRWPERIDALVFSPEGLLLARLFGEPKSLHDNVVKLSSI